MTHPADDFEALLRHAYAQFRAAGAAGSSTAPFAVVVGGDEACAAFGLVDPPPIFWDAVEALLFTLRHGASSGAYRAVGYCGADLFNLPTDHRRHYALHAHLEHRLGDAADYVLALDQPIPDPLRYEDWIRVEGDRQIFGIP